MKTSKLRQEHRELFNRVFLKAIVHTLLGSAILFLPPDVTPTAHTTPLVFLFDLRLFGALFLLCGAVIFYSLMRSGELYKLIRVALVISGSYSTLWFVALLASVFLTNPGALGVTILWGYFTLNQFIVAFSPGWRSIQIARHIQAEGFYER